MTFKTVAVRHPWRTLLLQVAALSYFITFCTSLYGQPGWIWRKGSNTPYSTGTFGVQGIPSSTNTPPALYAAAKWTDLQGNLWLFGGMKYNGTMADMWKYDVATNQWTWMKGPGVAGTQGVYGVQGVP